MTITNFSENQWSSPQKWGFRFIAAYLFWYIFPFPITSFSWLNDLTQPINDAWNAISVWLGKEVLQLKQTISTKRNGSGDKTVDYLTNLSILLVALITSIIWSIMDRKRPNYDSFLYWLQVLVRFYLAATLIGYGGAKIFKTQFPFPSLNRLIQPFGEASPMGLAWTYMGYSTSFNYFTGFGEAIAGFLLFFRQTKLLGTFIGISVMSTIVAMNFSYDIPVKLFSSNLLLMLVLLLIPEGKRILNFLFLNKTVEPLAPITPIKNERIQYARLVAKYGFIAFILYSNISSGLERVEKWGAKRVKPPLYGLYTAEQVIIDQDTIPPLLTENNRWHKVTIDYPDRATIKIMNGRTLWCDFKPDTTNQTIEFEIYSRMDTSTTLHYTILPNDQLRLEGILSSGNGTFADTVNILLQKEDLNQFLLVNRGFNWVNEYPFNR